MMMTRQGAGGTEILDVRGDAEHAKRRHDQPSVATIARAQGRNRGRHGSARNPLVERGMRHPAETEHREQRDDQPRQQAVRPTRAGQRHCGFIRFAGNIVVRTMAHGRGPLS